MSSSPDANLFLLPALGEEGPAWARPGLAADDAPQAGWAPPDLPRGVSEPAPPRLSRHAREIEDAFARGRAEGRAEGEAESLERLTPAMEMLAMVVESLEEGREQFARDRERNLHALAMAVARNLIQRDVVADPQIVGRLVAKALDLLPPEAAIEVRLHPADLETLGDTLAATSGAARPALSWVADPAIDRGGFLIDSPLRIVDGRTDVALRQLYERLEHD
jgi:flagellar biosynthesis/type III secretory pathway protein FliH